jgi:hypothetical protein
MEAAAQDCCPALQRELAECWLKVDDGTLVRMHALAIARLARSSLGERPP